MNIYVAAIDPSGTEVIPPQPFPAVPAAGSLIDWRETYVVRPDPVVWRRRELVRGATHWMAILTVDPAGR